MDTMFLPEIILGGFDTDSLEEKVRVVQRRLDSSAHPAGDVLKPLAPPKFSVVKVRACCTHAAGRPLLSVRRALEKEWLRPQGRTRVWVASEEVGHRRLILRCGAEELAAKDVPPPLGAGEITWQGSIFLRGGIGKLRAANGWGSIGHRSRCSTADEEGTPYLRQWQGAQGREPSTTWRGPVVAERAIPAGK